ncbi:MAG TPA: hypothetical protein VFQ93_12060 [Casimicrobiaceae bacterium]|jgi:DNA-binding LytR/AlgR family response regulator|nr:hypothetical protein [Casimicrobiaceae bacterium]
MAHLRYGVAAFEQGAIGYMLKPFSVACLATTTARLKEKITSGFFLQM